MLRKETISQPLMDALSGLMEMETIKPHRLVGGTALALQLGHRVSVDIYLFSDMENNYDDVLRELSKKFGKAFKIARHIEGPMDRGVAVFINNIKTDILDWNIKFIRPPLIVENIRLAHKEDIIPMKFKTFLGPAEYVRYEKKDYIDLAYLMKEFDLESMMRLYNEMFPNESMSERLIIEGLQLHKMADKKIMPKMLTTEKWIDIKQQIGKSIERFIDGKVSSQE